MENQTVIHLEVTPQELALMTTMFNQSTVAVRDMLSSHNNYLTTPEKELFKDETRHDIWVKLSKACNDNGIDWKYGLITVQQSLFK